MPRKKPQAAIEADDKALVEARGSIVKIRVGKRTYDAILDRNCPVCMHPGRLMIEERLLLNDTFPSISDMVSDVGFERIDGVRVDWPVITPQQIASHFRRKHVPANAQMLHSLTIERDAAMERGYEEMTGRVVDEIVFAKQTIARVQERAARGDIEPSFKEGLAAAKLVAQVTAAAQESETQDRTWYYEQAVQVFFEAAGEIMSEQQWRQFSRRLNTNPFLREIAERVQAPGTVEGEIVEEHAS